jgi:surfeit locus 1 family protein
MFMPALSKNGNNGFHILVPFKTSDNKFYVFDTGWIPLKLKEKSLRKNNLIIESKQFEVVIRIPGRKGYFQPDNDIIKNTWFFVEPSLMSEYLQIPFDNEIYLEATNNGPGGYPIGNQTRIYLRNNHLQYALTWMFLSFGLIGVFLFSNFKIIKK